MFVFGRIIASIIRIWPNSTDTLFGTALCQTTLLDHGTSVALFGDSMAACGQYLQVVLVAIGGVAQWLVAFVA